MSNTTSDTTALYFLSSCGRRKVETPNGARLRTSHYGARICTGAFKDGFFDLCRMENVTLENCKLFRTEVLEGCVLIRCEVVDSAFKGGSLLRECIIIGCDIDESCEIGEDSRIVVDDKRQKEKNASDEKAKHGDRIEEEKNLEEKTKGAENLEEGWI